MSDSFAPPPPPPEAWSGSTAGSQPVTPCGNGVRLGAALLDLLLFIVTCGIGWIIWWVVLWQQSTTPAKKMLGLKIVDVRTGAPATMQQMVLRELGGTVLDIVTSGLVTLISAVLILVTPARQGVWDYLAKTTVIKER